MGMQMYLTFDKLPQLVIVKKHLPSYFDLWLELLFAQTTHKQYTVRYTYEVFLHTKKVLVVTKVRVLAEASMPQTDQLLSKQKTGL